MHGAPVPYACLKGLTWLAGSCPCPLLHMPSFVTLLLTFPAPLFLLAEADLARSINTGDLRGDPTSPDRPSTFPGLFLTPALCHLHLPAFLQRLTWLAALTLAT